MTQSLIKRYITYFLNCHLNVFVPGGKCLLKDDS